MIKKKVNRPSLFFCLADLYDPVTMPPELRKAHRDNDRAVMAAYGFPTTLQESEIVAKLFTLYSNLIKKGEHE